MTESLEYKTVLACYDRLVTALKSDPVGIATELMADSLIPPLDVKKTDAQELARLLLNKVELVPERYHDIVEVFSRHGWLKDIVAILQTERSKLENDSVQVHSPSGDVCTESMSKLLSLSPGYSSPKPGAEGGATSDGSYKLELDCPHKQSSLDIPNPVVRFEELCEDDRKDLFAQMNELTKAIHTEFKKLLDQVYRSLKKRVQHDSVVLTLIDDGAMFFGDDDKLREAKDMFEVFKAIGPYLSYFNYDLLKLLVSVHGTSEDNKCLDGYLKSFASYCQAMPCAEEICGSGDSQPNRTKIKFKLNFDRQRIKADYIKDNIISNIAGILNIKPSSLYLHRIREGCVCLEFLIPSFLLDRIFPLSSEQKVALYREVNVTAIRWSLHVDIKNYAKTLTEQRQDTYTYTNTENRVSAFRTMLTHISELFTPDNARSLAYINGLPSPTNNTPHKPLDVLMELEKRGVFSHGNVDPLIGLLTDLHRVDIINTCQVHEYKDKAELASNIPTTEDSGYSSASTRQSTLASSNRPQSFDDNAATADSELETRSNNVGGAEQKTPNQNSFVYEQSPLATSRPLKAQDSSNNTKSLPVTMTTTSRAIEGLSKADLISSLASDPEAISLMREVLTGSARGKPTNGSGDKPQTLDLSDNLASLINKDEILRPTGSAGFTSIDPPTSSASPAPGDDLASPPIEYKSIDPSLYRKLCRQTSSISIQTEEAVSLPLGGGVVTESIAPSQGISYYGSKPLPSLMQAGYRGELIGATSADKSPSRPAPDFDPSVESTKVVWKVKRLVLCERICKHSSKVMTKDMNILMSNVRSRKARSRKARNLRKPCNFVKLVFQLYPYGIGKDESSFMSMKVGVHLDQKCIHLREMATLHLKITTSLPPTDFVTVKTASSSLEDFVINDFIPFDVVINHDSKNVEFLIEAYLNFDLHHVRQDMSMEEEKELIDSLTPLDDHHGNDEDDSAVGSNFSNF